MKLETLELTNFRQFKEGRINFSTDEDQNVTVIHGQNGAGKTTLLNAFTWVLYEAVDFDTREDRLVNEGQITKAAPGNTVTVEVQLTFFHENDRFRAARTVGYTKRNANDLDGEMGNPSFSLERQSTTGDWTRLSDGQTRVKQILPDRLRNLFFFDGEDIEELAGVNNQEQIQKAIQNVMGLTILERSMSHLKNVASEFESEYREYADDDVEELFKKRDKLEKQIEKKDSQIQSRKEKRAELSDRITEITAQLESIDESRELEQALQAAKEQRETTEAGLKDIDSKLSSELTKGGTLTLALPVVTETAADLEQLQENDLLGSEVSADFLDTLLERGRCVCGRPLEEHSMYYERVADLKSEVGVSDIGESAVRLIAAAEHADEDYRDFQETLTDGLEHRRNLKEELAATEQEIENLERELDELTLPTDSGSKSPAELKKEREEAESQRESLSQNIGMLTEQRSGLEQNLSEVTGELEDAREEQEQAAIAKKRWRATLQTRAEIESSFNKLQNAVRKLADQRVSSMFESIAHKDLDAEITDEFELRIRQRVGNQWTELSKGTGETQIASLAFIGSLVAIARERYEKDTESSYFTGGIYPIVMDSPFGALDDDHRRQVAHLIPDLGNQVIVLVTDSQWGGPVESEMGGIAGAMYTLNFDDGTGDGNYPETRIQTDTATRVN
ncbi:AAA family ATPase [Haloarcula sp. CGMCC 1.2071]|uniref:AAA family ATPase n=1 Tax=Haloarcula sp. CGMCC 1.2071 TaxID=3111454 RepID=UPI00300EA77F